MTAFQQSALILIAIWLALVAVAFQRSTVVLMGGLVLVPLFTFCEVFVERASLRELGLTAPASPLRSLLLVAAWLGVMLAYSPAADWVATRFFSKPPTLGAFRALQQSTAKLILGIAAAWILGGFLEELIFRGIVLQAIAAETFRWVPGPAAAAIAITVAALGAGIIHLYQGPRATIVIIQLSMLFGLLFVLSGNSLWTVILCHGLYDTIAFIRFATGRSRYSKPENLAR